MYIKYYATLRIIYGKRNSPQHILTVHAQSTESIVALKKRIAKTMQARGNSFVITTNDWFISVESTIGRKYRSRSY